MIQKSMKPLFLLLLLLLLQSIPSASAQTYPSRPITLVVPFAAGGPVDVVARVLSEPMRKSLGQAVVVDYTVGASGSVGVGRVARAAPDGYTVSIGHWGTHVVNGAVYALQYDLLKDLEPVGDDRREPDADRRQRRAAGEQPRGSDRMDQGQAGRRQRRHRRPGLGNAYQRRVFPERHRRKSAIHSL